MRLFIAINFEENIKNEIQDIIKEVRESSIEGRFVSKEHIHLTLEFIGEVPEEKIEIIKNVMDTAMEEDFTISLSQIGYFKRREGNIYWIGLKNHDELLKLQAKLHELLIKKGFELEGRAYNPHITLGRKIKLRDDFNPEEVRKKIEALEIHIDKIDLMESKHQNGKLTYSIIHSSFKH